MIPTNGKTFAQRIWDEIHFSCTRFLRIGYLIFLIMSWTNLHEKHLQHLFMANRRFVFIPHTILLNEGFSGVPIIFHVLSGFAWFRAGRLVDPNLKVGKQEMFEYDSTWRG